MVLNFPLGLDNIWRFAQRFVHFKTCLPLKTMMSNTNLISLFQTLMKRMSYCLGLVFSQSSSFQFVSHMKRYKCRCRLILYGRDRRSRSRWCPGRAETSAAQRGACSSERSVFSGKASGETAAPCRKASRSSRSSASALAPPTGHKETNKTSICRDFGS